MTKRLLLLILIVILAGTIESKITHKPEPKPTERHWTVADSKAYARDALYHWADKQFICLAKLWGKESAWNPKAYNKNKVMGKNAGGIPQILGLDPRTPAPLQIDRGFAYIMHRYGTPCKAWAFFQKKGYH